MIIISAILVCLIGLGIIGYYVEKDKAAEQKDVKIEEKVGNTENDIEEEKLVVDINKFDINKIEGYIPGENNQNISGRNLPYSIPYKNMEIVSIGDYSGKFMEDGSDENKDSVLAMVIKNTSKEVIDYGEITLKISGKSNTIKFKVTNLKPGACALVMESSGKVDFNPEDKYVYINSKSSTISKLPTMDSEIAVTTKDKKITVKNLSDKNLNTVYVYYKTISPGNCYLGGITYRAKFEKVESGKSVTVNTVHFSNTNSEILKIESVKK